MKRRTIFLQLYIILIIFLTGCGGAKELNQLGISLVIGLDREGDKILLTGEVVNPKFALESGASPGQGSSVKYVQGTGNTILEAFRDITLKFDRRLFVSHNKVIIFGEEFAKRGLVSQIDELYRDREQRETAYMLVAKGAKAYEVMGINNGLEEIPANYIAGLVTNIKDNPKTIDTNMVEFLKHYYHMGHQPSIGVIEKRKKRQINQLGQQTRSAEYELSVIGSAIFHEDTLIGYLSGNDTKSLNFLMNNIKGGIITFPTPPGTVDGESSPTPAVSPGMESKHANRHLSSIYIINNKTKNSIEINDGNIILKTKIKLRGSIGEVMGNIDISKEENIKKMEEACSKAIEEGITLAVKKAQKEYEADIFGFGLVFHRKYPEEWKKIEKNWNQVFSQADFKIEVDTDIIRTGLINTPINKIKGK